MGPVGPYGLFIPPPPPPPGITFPWSIADDMLGIVDGLTQATVNQCDPDTGDVTQTASNVTVLKKITGSRTVTIGEGEVSEVKLSRFRIWVSTCPFVPRYRDQILDAQGVLWWIGETVTTEGFGSFYVCDNCIQVVQ
jgi:hypothetical protein